MRWKGWSYDPFRMSLVFVATSVVLSLAAAVERKPIPRALERLGESLERASDEAARSVGKTVRNVSTHGDDVVERVLRGLADPRSLPCPRLQRLLPWRRPASTT